MQIVGTLRFVDSTKVWEYFSGEINQRFANIAATMFTEKQTSVFTVNSQLNTLSAAAEKAIAPTLQRFGVELVNFNVECVSIPEGELARFQEIMGRRMEIDQISKAHMGSAYTTMRTFDTLEKAAANQGGTAGTLIAGGLGMGVGLGAGVPLGRQVGEVLDMRPPADVKDGNDKDSDLNRLQKLKNMLNAKLITEDEFDAKKRKILNEL